MSVASRPRVGVGRVVVTLLFVALAFDAWRQVVDTAIGHASEPAALTVLKVLGGTCAVATAWGAWTRARWAWAAALAYGLVIGGMLAALGPLLHLPREANRGLWMGAGIVLGGSLLCAWYLRWR